MTERSLVFGGLRYYEELPDTGDQGAGEEDALLYLTHKVKEEVVRDVKGRGILGCLQ